MKSINNILTVYYNIYYDKSINLKFKIKNYSKFKRSSLPKHKLKKKKEILFIKIF